MNKSLPSRVLSDLGVGLTDSVPQSTIQYSGIYILPFSTLDQKYFLSVKDINNIHLIKY